MLFIFFIFFFFFKLFIYLFLAALGLRCWVQALSSCGERGPLFAAVRRPLITVASPCRRAQTLGMRASAVVARRLSSCGARAQLLRGTWDPPGPGPEPVSPALAGGLLTTAPPGKSQKCFLNIMPSLTQDVSHTFSSPLAILRFFRII